tara:strand:- start:35 stop:1276 length:1242 start_codon:yes stop_codon:yes gene_type:complete
MQGCLWLLVSLMVVILIPQLLIVVGPIFIWLIYESFKEYYSKHDTYGNIEKSWKWIYVVFWNSLIVTIIALIARVLAIRPIGSNNIADLVIFLPIFALSVIIFSLVPLIHLLINCRDKHHKYFVIEGFKEQFIPRIRKEKEEREKAYKKKTIAREKREKKRREKEIKIKRLEATNKRVTFKIKREKYIKGLPKEVKKIINEKQNTIINAYRKLVKVRSFGQKNYDKFAQEFGEFLSSESKNITKLNELTSSNYMLIVQDNEIRLYEANRDRYVDEHFGLLSGVLRNPIDYIEKIIEQNDFDIKFDPNMDPFQYEIFCAEKFKENDWEAYATQGSSDQGVDVVATRGKEVLVAQCKKFSKPVGNKAVQEVVAGMKFYDANAGIVIAPNGFTNSAEKLAAANKIKLIHHSQIKDL